ERPTIAVARRLICVSDLERARGLLEVAATHAGDRGDEATRGHVLFHLVMLEWFAGRWERALEHAGAALDLAQPLGDDQFRGMVLHARALVEAHRGDVEAARTAAAKGEFDAAFDAFDRALAQHDRMPGRFERGRTLLSYGTARRRARERGAARRALKAALEIFEEQGAELWARRAADELRRISGRR